MYAAADVAIIWFTWLYMHLALDARTLWKHYTRCKQRFCGESSMFTQLEKASHEHHMV